MAKPFHTVDYSQVLKSLQSGILYNRNNLTQAYFNHLFRNNLTRLESSKLFKYFVQKGFVIPFGKTKHYMWSKKITSHYFIQDDLKQIFEENNIQSQLGGGKNPGRKKGQKYVYNVSNKSNFELLDMIDKCKQELDNRKLIENRLQSIKDLADDFGCSVNDLSSTINLFLKKNKKNERI